MEIEIATIGGYEEVGRQMTAVRAGGDIVVFDMGLNLSKVLIHDDLRTEQMHSLDLIDLGAIPKLAHRYDAPVIGTPFTIELVKDAVADESKFTVNNELVAMDAGEST